MKKVLNTFLLIMLVNVVFCNTYKNNASFEPIKIIREVVPEIMQKIIDEKELDNCFLNEYYIFVLNIVEIDNKNNKMSFSLDFIAMRDEYDRVNPTHYIKIKKKIVLIKGCSEEVFNRCNFKSLKKSIAKKVNGRLYFSPDRLSGITYRGYAAIVNYEQGKSSIEYIWDEWSVPDIYKKYSYDYLKRVKVTKYKIEDIDSLELLKQK